MPAGGTFWRSGAVPPRWGRGPESPVVRTLRVVRAFPVPRGAAPRGPACPAGASVIDRWFRWKPLQGGPCNVGSRPVPGGGSRLSLEKARTQRVAGGDPRPPFFMARSFPLAHFGGCAALFRSWGCFVPHLRALIWDAFSCGVAQPRGFPLGKH